MAQSDLPKGVHRVRRSLTSGKVRWHFYAWRGGPKFWEDDRKKPIDPNFYHSFTAVASRPKPSAYMTDRMVDDFLSSAAMPKGERSKQDIRKWALRFADHFRDAPAVIFEDRASRGEINTWRAQWMHSPKQHDMAGTHAVRVLNWAVGEGKLAEHFCHRLPKIYEVDRSEIVWTPADCQAFDAVAPEWVRRILCVACETGLRPADLTKLTLSHVEQTPQGRRLRVRTNKRKRLAHIPVTPGLATVIDTTPVGQLLILTSAHGLVLTPKNASDGIRQWRDKAKLSSDLRLQDTRGTAATCLLNGRWQNAKPNHARSKSMPTTKSIQRALPKLTYTGSTGHLEQRT